MRLVLCVAVVLFGLPLGKMFVLHPSPEASSSSSSSSAVKTKRCRGELEIRKILLESLNLQQEPRVSVSWMSLLREQWRDSLKSAVPSSTGNSSIPEDSGNSTCCKYSSQVFMKDLGWDRWVVYPESVTFCCKPTAHDIVPFVYVDEWSSLVLSSASLTRECGCDTQELEVTTPS
ncbi:hypothetical protein DPX16_12581 [Anabarilius grahami]|uniref:TGF-beta family profile domain-containing protein n=1 Tax=Anabarilius grahami TaxID=495550 RepID=A0A3N0YLL3_ANAGA|nr:hypothetical protein DPX16_12581 [Anabarilius grahami]